MTEKIGQEFVKRGFSSQGGVAEYAAAAKQIALWGSERLLFTKYFKKTDYLLDLGCGTGRTTFGLRSMGYEKLTGLDLSEAMLEQAREIGRERCLDIPFVQGDATRLQYNEGIFDGVLFAFNGIMQIPGQANRQQAFDEISRVLKDGGYFIFTTHDRDSDKEHAYYWKEEARLWTRGTQNPRLVDFGDLIYHFYDREMFVHVPARADVLAYLAHAGFELIEDHLRSELFQENQRVQEFSDECRFYVARKKEKTT